MLTLLPRKKTEDELVLALGNGHRYFFYFLFVYFLYLIITDDKNTGSNLGPMVIAGICFLSGSYHESWIFHRPSGRVEHRLGFLFLFRRKKLKMTDIQSVKITGFIRKRNKPGRTGGGGYPAVAFLKLLLIKHDGSYWNVETVKSRDMTHIENKAELIASFCGVGVSAEDL